MKNQDLTQDLEIQNLQGNVSTLQKKANELEIIDSKTQEQGNDMRSEVRKIEKKIEERRKYFTAPMNEIIKKINNQAKDLKKPLQEVNSIISQKIFDYQDKLEIEKRKAEERAKKKIEKDVEKGKPAPAIPVPQIESNIQSEKSTTTMIDNWKAEVTNEKDFIKWAFDNNELQYFEINMKNLNALAKLKKDIQGVPGVRFYNDRYLSSRDR